MSCFAGCCGGGGAPANIKAFFKACETGQGWDACKKHCTPDATFAAQSEPLADIITLEAYTNWMASLATQTMPGCSYEIHFEGFDAKRSVAVFFATFKGTHTGPGPCPPTGKSTVSHYLYAISLQGGKIFAMTKVWNAPWAMRQLGWAPGAAAPPPLPIATTRGQINPDAGLKFFEACETGKGWMACKEYCTPNATFQSQAEPLQFNTVQQYTDWMRGLATQTMPGCGYDLKFAGEDRKTGTVGFYALFTGKHTGPGGPVHPTGYECRSDYAYFIHFDTQGKIDSMVKVWNANWAMKALGWQS